MPLKKKESLDLEAANNELLPSPRKVTPISAARARLSMPSDPAAADVNELLKFEQDLKSIGGSSPGKSVGSPGK
jgi:hypothetical protein